MNRSKVILFLISSFISFALPIQAVQRQYLHDGWIFGQSRQKIRYKATVPGEVHLDLLANKVIEDPFFGMNERKVQWVDKEDWIYETSFRVEKDIFDKDNIEIVFNGLDTYADVYLNDVSIIKADNMFRKWNANVKHLIKEGDNHLKVYFHSPLKVDMPKWEKMPYRYFASNDQSENGGIFDMKLSVFSRKAGFHYGWDWGPRLVSSGIWRDVFLEGWNDARIRDVFIRQNDVCKSKASLSDIVEVEAGRDMQDVMLKVKDKATGKILASGKYNLKKGANTLNIDFVVRNPRLWWCNGMGKPELYMIETSLSDGNSLIAIKDERIGLRKIEVVTTPHEDGTMQFYFKLNGIPFFAKGSNYIPQDSFVTRVSDDQYRSTIDDAVAANMNMLRIWGGGTYEKDFFYDLCDEKGIMVWQDFMFGCSIYPMSGDFRESVRREAIDNVCRLRNHPSIALWCGGNECIDGWYNWGWKSRLEKDNQEIADKVFEELKEQYFVVLPEVVREYAPATFYWPQSPFSGELKGSDVVNGDAHYWSVWKRKMPISAFNDKKSHFFSEYGMQSFPAYGTIIKFAPDTSWHSIDSEVIMSHQRGGEEANQLIKWQIDNEYGKEGDFKDFIYMSQVMQADAMRVAIEAHRRNMPYCMGSLLWQHNDCWPVASWSTRDYYGNWKAAHYSSRKAFQNQIVSAEIAGDSLKVFTVSDILERVKGRVDVTVYSLDGRKIYDKALNVSIKPNTSDKVWETSIKSLLGGSDPRDVVVNVSLTSTRHKHDGNYFVCMQRELNLCPADIKTEIIEGNDGESIVNVRSDKFVRALCLSLEGEDAHFDDNYFDLLPGETKSVTVRTGLNPRELESRLRITNMNAIYNNL